MDETAKYNWARGLILSKRTADEVILDILKVTGNMIETKKLIFKTTKQILKEGVEL